MKEKRQLLINYLEVNVAPILVDFLVGEDLHDALVLPANIDIKELNGHYENIDYLPPKWFKDLLKKDNKLLVIDKIDTISKEEQLKFGELLKYRKLSTFDLPNDCRILVTANKINKDVINEEIVSLVAVI